MPDKKWLTVTNKANKKAEVSIYGVIYFEGWDDGDVTPRYIKDELAKIGDAKDIDLLVNSPGGSVFAGMAIYNILNKSKARITTYIEGVAASIAGVVSLVGSKIFMPDNSLFMLHNPTISVGGESKELIKAAEILAKIKENIINVFENKTQQTRETIAEWMDNETWFTSKEAFEAGIIDEETKSIPATNCNNGVININNQYLSFDKYKGLEAAYNKIENKQKSNNDLLKKEREYLNSIKEKYKIYL